jgi:2,5-diketo-D-gluconate reductase B
MIRPNHEARKTREAPMKHVEAHGAKIPALGFGTFRLEGRRAEAMVETALGLGYRHIDTAQMYGNEAGVGRGIAASGVARAAIWLTTKIWPDNFRPSDLQRAARASVERLGTAPDLLLLHWPNPRVPLAETVAALNRVHQDGLARFIGVSNFNRALVKEAWAASEAPLIVDQVEYQPFLDQSVLLDELRARGMGLIAYAPLAHGRVFEEPVLQRIGAAHGKTPGQVTLRWLIQQDGVCAIPKSGSETHARANLEIFDFELSAEEMAAIYALARPNGRIIDPAGMAPEWD